MRFEEFVGGAYQSASPNADASRSVNLLVEVNESAGAKSRKMLVGRPGMAQWSTLPTSPIRALFSGEDRLFAATGSRLYEVSEAGTPTELGVIATDASNSPVQMYVNGSQLFVISAGNAYIHDGANLFRCIDGGAATKAGEANPITRYKVGAVNTSGTAVTHASGDFFDSVIHAAGKDVYIAGVPYVIATFNSTTSLTLTTSAGTLSAAAYWSGSLLTWSSGDQFDSVTHAAGALIQLEGQLYEISLYLSVTQIVLKQDSALASGSWRSLVATPEIQATGTVNTNATAVTYASGALFDPVIHQAGNQIVINGIWYTIAAYNSSSSLTLYGYGAGVQTGANYVSYKFLSAITGGYLNGYFLAQQPKTLPDGSDGRMVRISGLLDGSNWDALDFVSKDGRPDSLRSILVDNLECYMFGQKSVEVWRATSSESILARDPGAFAEMGSLCRWAPVSLAGAVYFISGDDRGQPIAIRLNGFTPQRVSTAAVEKEWQSYALAGAIDDAIGFAYVESGHSFWVITFPTANHTWVFDAGTNLWHEWGFFDGTTMHRHQCRCHTVVWDQHFQGDRTSGTIWKSGFHLFGDGQYAMRCQRTAPHIHDGEENRIFYREFQLDMDTGTAATGTVDTSGTAVTYASGEVFDPVAQAAGKTIHISGVEYTIAAYNSVTSLTLTASAGSQTGAAYSVEPQVLLDWSEDDGATFNSPRIVGSGAAGAKTKRVIWRRLGSGRDRVFRVTVDSKARQGWSGAIIRLEAEK